MVIFDYRPELSEGQVVYRPVADVWLRVGKADKWIEFHPYIDSGADMTLIPLSLGNLLRLKKDLKKVHQLGGISGSIPVMYVQQQLRIGEEVLEIRLAWALVEEVPPLLGRLNVFDVFEVIFRQREKKVWFKKV